MIQEVFIYLDDSGVLHKNEPNRFFAYAGYVFLSQKEKDHALAKYRAAVKNSVKNSRKNNKELKAFNASNGQKRYLLSTMKQFESFSCVVDK